MPVAMLSTSLITEPKRYGRFNALDTENPFADQAMVLMVPTSVSVTGGSASITGNGQVTFSGISVLNVDGVFTSEYRNYMISIKGTTTGSNPCMRMRVGGVQNSTNYISQYASVSGTSLGAGLESSAASRTAFTLTNALAGATLYFYRPALADITVWRALTSNQTSGAAMEERMNHHNVSTAYDGFNLLPVTTGTLTGTLQVYGVKC